MILSCENLSHNDKDKNYVSESPKKYQVGLHLSKGDKFYYTIINETKTQLEINQQQKVTGNNYQIGLIYEVGQDSLGNVLLKITYDKIHIIIKHKDEDDEIIDADNDGGAFDSVEKLLSFIKGSPITISLSKTGDIISIKGNKEISGKVMASLINGDINFKNKVQELLSQLVGDDFIKNNLQQNFKVFPDTALYIGDSWTRKSSNEAGINFEANTKYVFSSVEDGVADVEVEGIIGNGKPTTTNLMGKDVTTNLKGDQSGILHIDEKTGMVLTGKIKTSIEGTVQVMGREVPIIIKMSKEIQSKRL